MGRSGHECVRIATFGFPFILFFIMTSIKGRYARIEIPLDKVETDKELFLTGDYLSIISTTGEGSCEIRLDHRHSQKIDLREITGITGLFERVYFTSDGGGGMCTMFIGTGMAIMVSPDPQNIWSGGSISTQVTSSNVVVYGLANASLKVKDVSILNSNGIYACYVGPWVSNAATFRAHAYVLLPHKTLHFSEVDMYSLGVISYDGVNNVIIDVIGTYT